MPPKAQPKKNLSALKRVRQAKKQELRNKAVRSKVKTIRKKLVSVVASKNKDAVSAVLKEAVKVITSAASKGAIHKNTASRNISRLSKLANTILKA
ncbi:MAG: 30S ribosomal protein S20 [Nitrospirae bacterium]|nr:30S ribosomal protein S20 [Nitrospirota bacterium]